VPEWYQLQVLHQLAVTGRKWADVAVLLGGQEFRIYRINRDEDMIQNLIQLEQEFWHLVQTDTQPKADGSESSARALALLYPHDNGITLDYADDTAMNSLFTNLVEVRTTRQQAEAQEEAIRQQLQEKLGDATVAVFADGKVSWKRSKDGVGVDTKRLLAEHPDLSSQYSMTKPGSRRFTVTLNKGEAA
jgi:predicted phage-related endonuclease